MSKFNINDYRRLKINYENKIQTLSTWLWENRPTKPTIEEWLQNFSSQNSDREQLNALHQLSHFMSFELREIREMLKSLYRDHFIKPLIQGIKKSGSIGIDKIDSELKQHKERTRFIGIGNASESSCIMLYFFRQENGIRKEQFINVSDIFIRDEDGKILDLTEDAKQIEHYIFIDDFSGSGSQASGFFLKNQIEKVNKINPNAKLYYFTLFSTKESNIVLKGTNNKLILRSVFELDDTYKVFSAESRYYANLEEEKTFSQDTCMNYKNRYLYSHPDYLCGWRDGQLLLRFFYNTPDNTLPTFWTETNQWKPVFKRYDKKY